MLKKTVYKIDRQKENNEFKSLEKDTVLKKEVENTKKNKQKRQKDIDRYKKTIKTHTNDNLYLYTQIIIVLIFLVAGIIFKSNGGENFENVKTSYDTLLKTETAYESNFSYQSFLSKFKENIEEKYNQLMQAVSYAYGKGSNDLSASNVSLDKYTLKNKGIKPIEGYVTSPFGVRKDPFNSKKKDFHTGMDIAAEKGTFVKASFQGEVIASGYSEVSGNYIRIKTDDTLESFYGHNQFLFVKTGDFILQGQVIASLGQTGMATGPHVHLEIIYNNVRVNPVYALE